jgi:predicted Zn-dependent protease
VRDPDKLAAAAALAAKARETLPADPGVARTLGVAYYLQGQLAPATAVLAESHRNRPLDPEGMFYLGMAHAKSNQPDAARPLLEQALAEGLPEPMASEAKQALETGEGEEN